MIDQIVMVRVQPTLTFGGAMAVSLDLIDPWRGNNDQGWKLSFEPHISVDQTKARCDTMARQAQARFHALYRMIRRS